jgi:hypothetical protein
MHRACALTLFLQSCKDKIVADRSGRAVYKAAARLLAGNVGSYLAGGMDVCCECCVLSVTG